jgi:hypothetical protein
MPVFSDEPSHSQMIRLIRRFAQRQLKGIPNDKHPEHNQGDQKKTAIRLWL